MNVSSTFENSQLIKSDRVGRSHYSDSFKAEVLAAFENSSLSGQAFAEQCGIKYPTFASWRAKAKREDKEGTDSEVMPFVVAELGSDTCLAGSGLTVTLPGGSTATAHDETSVKLLVTLIKALA